MKILIADDDEFALRLLEKSLNNFDDEIIAVSNGDKAWECISTGEIHLVITDWNMPGLSGVDLIQKVRQEANLSHYVYMVLLTGRSNQDDILIGLESGADDYLVKPFIVPELKARVSIGKRILNYQKRLRETQDRLLELATHDSLTGLLNRRAIYERLNEEIERASRSSKTINIILFDIDHFKKVNDTYGHLIGDQVLCLVADKIQRGVRPYEWVGRWGGEEFLAVLPQTTEEQALKIAERIRNNVTSINFSSIGGIDDLQIRISGGVGSGTVQGIRWDLDRLIHKADVALYEAKRLGRNQICQVSKLKGDTSGDVRP